MSIKVTILGCGSATPTLFRNPTAQWIEIQGANYLVDCGEGTQTQLMKFKLKMSKLKAIFISHLHGDHFFGLPGLISSMHLMGRREKLDIYGPKGLGDILGLIFKSSETELRFPLNILEVDSNSNQVIMESASIEVYSIPLKHRIPCAGFLFKEKPRLRNLRGDMIKEYNVPYAERKRLKQGEDFVTFSGEVIPNRVLTLDPKPSVSYAYCSDTAPSGIVVQATNHVTAMYHEATFENDLEARAKETFHSTASQAASQAKAANVGKLYLGHFSSRYRDTSIILAQAQAVFPDTELVYDGFNFEVM